MAADVQNLHRYAIVVTQWGEALLSSFDLGGEELVGGECNTCHRCVLQHAYNVAFIF